MPQRKDLREGMPPVYQQANLGSCGSQATRAAHWYVKNKQINEGKDDDKRLFTPSSLFLYYNTRALENTVEYDAGVTLRGTMKALWKYGNCPEELWPYLVDRFALKPSKASYTAALDSQALHYYRISADPRSVMKAISSGLPVIFGAAIYDSFESQEVAKTGKVPMPQKSESLLGGHAMLMVGFDQTEKHVIVRNSWGPEFADKGYLYLPFDYIKSPLIMDCWVLSSVE